eukprot:scaffold22574_cov61-Phaeocystis_antarctica.AAC.3
MRETGATTGANTARGHRRGDARGWQQRTAHPALRVLDRSFSSSLRQAPAIATSACSTQRARGCSRPNERSRPPAPKQTSAMFVARSMFAAPSPAAAAACASTRAGDSKTAQCSPWCGPAHCGSWCKCRACPICASPPPPPPPRALAPPPPPRACTSTVAGDANVEGCASWCREKESAATHRVRRWHSGWPALWLHAETPSSLVQAPPLSHV